MSAADRRQKVRELYDFRCGYCGISETDAGSLLTLDHFQPASKGGSDTLDNLVYCCHACNEFKNDYWNPESDRRILHPKREALAEHLILAEDGKLEVLTPTGEFHLKRLRLNREALIAHRLVQVRLTKDRAERQALLGTVAQLEQRIETLKTLVSALVPLPDNDELS